MANNVMNMDGSFKPFKFWCQHVLPSVYDDSLSYMELLNKVVAYINGFGEYLEEWTAVNKLTYEGMWDITKQYPAWSIVSVNGEAGYVAIQPVPAGINYTNEDYWRMIADFTAEIMGLGERVLALEGDVADINLAITGIRGDITAVNGRVDTTNGNVSAINTTLTHNKIRDVESCVWIGDSYTSAGSLGQDVDQRFSTKVSEYLGLTEYNYAVGGTGYIYGPTPYTAQVANAITDFTNNDRDRTKVKYCFVMGNRNDADASYSWGDYATAIDTVVNNLCNFFTNATIIVIPGMWDGKLAKTLMIRYCSIIQERVSTNNRCLFFDNAWTWLTGMENLILWQNGADVHPNVDGHKILANHIISCLAGNNFNRIQYFEFIPTSTNEHISDCTIIIKIINNIAYFQARFKSNATAIGGELFAHSFGNLNLANLFIIDTQVYADVKTQVNTQAAKVTVNQVLSKSDDNTGSLYTNAYCYNATTGQLSTTGWNWIEFSVPYGIKRITYN